MKVLLKDIPTHVDVGFEPARIRELLSKHPLVVALERGQEDEYGEIHASLDFLADQESVFARGHLQGWVDVACSRCIEPVRIEVQEKVAVTYLPKAQVPKDDEISDEELLSAAEDDVELYPYENEEIDLEPLIREQYLMSIPFAPLCEEACKGLCTVCGTNLNQNQCQCDRHVGDPRLAALKNLKV